MQSLQNSIMNPHKSITQFQLYSAISYFVVPLLNSLSLPDKVVLKNRIYVHCNIQNVTA